MDIAPKAAFLSTVVLPGERTAVMGFVNVIRMGSQSLGPVITGVVSQWGGGGMATAFVVAGCLKAGYDLALLWMFVGYQARGEMTERDRIQTSNELEG